jgi:hypothetical protein
MHNQEEGKSSGPLTALKRVGQEMEMNETRESHGANNLLRNCCGV